MAEMKRNWSARPRKRTRKRNSAKTSARGQRGAMARRRKRVAPRGGVRTAVARRGRKPRRPRIVKPPSPPSVRRKRLGVAADDLTLGQKVPNKPEKDVVGAATMKIVRGTAEFAALVSNTNAKIVFKDEEGTGADRMMTKRLGLRLDALADLVSQEWSGVKLRVTEAWDENDEHGANSVHYEARGADLTTSPVDDGKLGRLGRLAVDAGLEWVFFEDSKHIHASMAK